MKIILALWVVLFVASFVLAATFLITTAKAIGPVGQEWPLDDGAPGKVSTAHQFNGVQDYVDAQAFEPFGDDLTVMAWATSFDLNNCGSGDCRIFSKATGVNEQDHYIMVSTIKQSGQIKLRFRLKAGGVTSTLIGGVVNDFEWFHVAATYDGSAMRLYKNGVLVGQKAKIGDLDNSSAITWIGGNPPDPESRPWRGSIDQVVMIELAYDEARILNEMSKVDGPTPTPTPSCGV